MVNKTLNHRDQFKIETNQTFASNYYPITTAIAGKDIHSQLQVAILNDHTQGGSAGLRHNNNIELMQNRRLLIDDQYGVTEPLDE